MNSTKKCNVFLRLIYSFIPSKYGTLAFQSSGSTFLFMLLFAVLIAASTVGSMFQTMKMSLQELWNVDTIGQVVEKNVPDFTIENGKLDMVEPMNYSVGKVCFYIDSTVEEISMSDAQYLVNNSGFDAFIIGSATNTFIYNGQTGEMQMAKYSQMFTNTVTKQSLIDLLDEWTSIQKVGPFLGGIFMIGQLIGHFILALLACIVLMIFSMFLHRNTKIGKVLAMSIYVLVPWMVLEQVLLWLPVSFPEEITKPIFLIMTIVLGCFGLFSVHEASMLEHEEKFKYNYEQNPYRISGVTPGNAGVISDEDFGGYATADTPRPSYSTVNGNAKVRLKGIEVEHSDLELIDKYIKGNLKDLAVQQLGEITGLNILDCREVVEDWNRYYY